MNRCKDCKHFRSDADARPWARYALHNYGECIIKLGDKVDIVSDHRAAGLDSVDVDGDFGCVEFTAAKTDRPEQ